MKGQVHIIPPEGGVSDIEQHEFDAPPTLSVLQEYVGGYIEMVPLLKHFTTKDGLKPCVAYCNEDGRHLGLPENKTANSMWADSDPMLQAYPLVGTVVVLTGDDDFMNAL